MKFFNALLVSFFVTLFFVNSHSHASMIEGPFREEKVSGNFLKPAHIDFDEKNVQALKLPKGFRVSVFAKDTGHTRTMVEDASGLIYLSDPEAGEIYTLKENSEGKLSDKKIIVSGIEKINGMILHADKLYFVAVQKIYELDLKKSDAKPKVIAEGLPDGGQHHNRVIHEGPDGFLYVSIGSTCNSCNDANKDNATLQKMKFDGSGRTLVAKGLRDMMGFDWSPQTHQLYGADHGVDWRGDAIPPEELDMITPDGNYGWPFCWGDKKPDPNLIDEPKGSTKAEYCKNTIGPVLTFPAHSAPIDLKFYNASMFGADYQGSAFITMHGSWNRKPASGYKIVRVVFKDGKPVSSQDFMTGFLTKGDRGAYGRPAGLLVHKDGSLLMSDDESGVIYKISFTK